MQKPVVIFGATGGFGSAIARNLAAAGQPLVLVGRDQTRLKALGLELGVAGDDLIAVDVTDADAVADSLTALMQRHPALAGAVVSVASRFHNKLAHRQPWIAFSEQIDIHLKALHSIMVGLRPMLVGQEGGARVVLISTEYILGAPPVKTAPYAAAKAAMTAYAQVIAQEWLRDAVRVHILAPGMSRTDLVGDIPDIFLQQVEDGMPEKMLTRVEDVAAVTAFCLTAAADPLYGEPIRVSRANRR